MIYEGPQNQCLTSDSESDSELKQKTQIQSRSQIGNSKCGPNELIFNFFLNHSRYGSERFVGADKCDSLGSITVDFTAFACERDKRVKSLGSGLCKVSVPAESYCHRYQLSHMFAAN